MDRSIRILVFIGGKVQVIKLTLADMDRLEERVEAFFEDAQAIVRASGFFEVPDNTLRFEEWEKEHELVWEELKKQLISRGPKGQKKS